jgi:hypothetical protein
MGGLFRPLEGNVGPSIVTVDVLCFVFFWGGVVCRNFLQNPRACPPFVTRDISTVNWISEFYYLD